MRACKCGAPLDYAADDVRACWACRDRVMGAACKVTLAALTDAMGAFHSPHPWVLTASEGGLDFHRRDYAPPAGRAVKVYCSFTNQSARCSQCRGFGRGPYGRQVVHLAAEGTHLPWCDACYQKANA